MTTTAIYKGPVMHNRVLTKQQLSKALDLKSDDFPSGFKELRWESGSKRKPVDISDMPQMVKDLIIEDPAFTVKEDGEVSSEADPNAAVVNPDGSSPGVDGSQELRDALGEDDLAPQNGDADAEANAGARGRGRSTRNG